MHKYISALFIIFIWGFIIGRLMKKREINFYRNRRHLSRVKPYKPSTKELHWAEDEYNRDWFAFKMWTEKHPYGPLNSEERAEEKRLIYNLLGSRLIWYGFLGRPVFDKFHLELQMRAED